MWRRRGNLDKALVFYSSIIYSEFFIPLFTVKCNEHCLCHNVVINEFELLEFN